MAIFGNRSLFRFFTIIVVMFVAVAMVTDFSSAQEKKSKKKKKKKPTSATTLRIDSVSNFKPTHTNKLGTVGGYYFPNKLGANWTLMTVQTLITDSGLIARSDTIYMHEEVIDTARFSLQGLPLMVCKDFSYRLSKRDTNKSESSYYVDDSIAMTVFNNSVTQKQNRTILVSPLVVGNSWKNMPGDTLGTTIISYVDSLVTPVGRFDSVLVTLTTHGNSDFRKFYAFGRGVVKMIYRSTGPGGHGLVIVTTQMIEFTIPKGSGQ